VKDPTTIKIKLLLQKQGKNGWEWMDFWGDGVLQGENKNNFPIRRREEVQFHLHVMNLNRHVDGCVHSE
jgi:hypothetical protein